MKTLIIYLVLAVVAGTSHAQQITELKEAKVGFAPLTSEVERDGNNFSFNIKEASAHEFDRDPVAFMEAYFDIKNFIAEVKEDKFDTYLVSFKSRKGKLEADFNKKGELVRSTSIFKNILLPKELREKLYSEHKGWVMVKNTHITRGRNGLLTEDIYKIKLVNGKERKNIVFEAPNEDLRVVSN